MLVHAVLIDTVSIQKYVFGSNKLKENLGASYLMQDIYESHLQKTAQSIFPSGNLNFNAWKDNPDKFLIEKNGVNFEVGYIGGGKGLLFFRHKDDTEEFIKKWTRTLLIEAPGVITAIASDTFDTDNFKEKNKKLFKILQKNKNRYIPQTVLPRHGITAECSRTGYSMDICYKTLKDKDYVSSVAYGKLRYAEKSKESLSKKYAEQLSESFCFTNDIEKLGQSRDEDSHIAIVHIDGNNMGERFREVETLEEIRKLSVSVENATKNSFSNLLSTIISQSDQIEEVLGGEFPGSENGKNKILPLRPIIIGGDDITFVSDGKLGVYFARIFLTAFEKQKEVDGKDLNLTASAGIAITKTKYPFYRGYQLAEELCRSAKSGWKKNGDTGSWLDFHVAYGGFSGTLEEIRSTHYKGEGGDLFMRPYHIGGDDELSFDGLIRNTGNLLWKDKGVRNFPRSKIMEMREVLTLGKDARKTFVEDMKNHKRYIPKINGRSYDLTLFENTETPYLDMIELMEFYPSFELDK